MEMIAIERWKRTFKYMRLFLWLAFIGSLLCTLTIAGLIIFAKWQGPPPLAVPQSTIFMQKMAQNWRKPLRRKRYWIKLSDMSQHAIDATIAIEDRNF